MTEKMAIGPIWKTGMCTVCGGENFLNILKLDNVPSQDGLVWNTKREALNAPSGNIDLRFCRQCGYLGNAEYDASKVQFQGYDVSLEFSELYREFVDWLIRRLVEQYDIRQKTVLEVACGKGHFLRALCRDGKNKGIGFDPSYESEGQKEDTEVQFIRDFYSKTYSHLRGDLLCCRQMVDILDEPREFLHLIHEGLQESPNAVCYFEIPNAAATWERFVPWNVVYEHCSWFMPKTLSSFMESCGFEVIEVYPCHHDEYLGIEVRRKSDNRITTRMSDAEVSKFEQQLMSVDQQLRDAVGKWKETLSDLRSSRQKIAAWGAGARAIGFLNAVKVFDQIEIVADINPRRQGKFLPSTAQKVVSPEELKSYAPDVVIITNPTYENEIKKHASQLNINARFITI